MKISKTIFLLFLSYFSFSYYTLNCMQSDRPTKQGIIVIINGTSSSGKSGISKHLMTKLDSIWIRQAADDIPDEDLEIYEDHPDKEIDEPINGVMVSRIINLASAGFNVVCDTVLEDPKDIHQFLEELHDFKCLTVLVYCPFHRLPERVILRNSIAKSPEATEEQIDDGDRTVHQALVQFGSIYISSTSPKQRSSQALVDILSKSSVTEICSSPTHFRNSPACMLEQFTNSILVSLDFQKEEDEIQLSPKFDYGLIVKNEKSDDYKQNVADILKFISEAI